MGKMFGVTIKIARKNKKLTQEELAQKVGVQPATVSRWENGKLRNLKLSHIQGLSDALDIPVQRLIDLDNESDAPRATSRDHSWEINSSEAEEAVRLLPPKEHDPLQQVMRYIKYQNDLEILQVVRDAVDMKVKSIEKTKTNYTVQMPDGSIRVIKFQTKEGDDHEDA